MLKTNTKQVKERLNNYILENTQDYNEKQFENVEEAKKYIIHTFMDETLSNKSYSKSIFLKHYYSNNLYEAFKHWMQGLPSVFNALYYYNISAVELLGDMLEETQEERNKFTERQAEEKLTQLLFNTIVKNNCDLIFKLLND